jgi:transcriptional regulator with XRE-family HTH domain
MNVPVVVPSERRPLSYYQRHHERLWPEVGDYRLDLKHVPQLRAALRAARKALGLTQTQLAELISDEEILDGRTRRERRAARQAKRRRLTCSESTIRRIELGIRAPSVRMSERLIAVLKLSPVIAQQLLAESAVPRGARAYVKPWQRPPGYQPQPSRRLGMQGAAEPLSPARQPGPSVSQIRIPIMPTRTFANFRRRA